MCHRERERNFLYALNITKQIFDLIFNTNNELVQYKKTINTVFISSDIDNSSVFKDELKIRLFEIFNVNSLNQLIN